MTVITWLQLWLANVPVYCNLVICSVSQLEHFIIVLGFHICYTYDLYWQINLVLLHVLNWFNATLYSVCLLHFLYTIFPYVKPCSYFFPSNLDLVFKWWRPLFKTGNIFSMDPKLQHGKHYFDGVNYDPIFRGPDIYKTVIFDL